MVGISMIHVFACVLFRTFVYLMHSVQFMARRHSFFNVICVIVSECVNVLPLIVYQE